MDTPNPILIMVINMTIVFAVLYVLGLFIKLIHVIDPTRLRKKEKSSVKVEPVKSNMTTQDEMTDKTLAAVIITALMAYGCRDFKIKSIKKKI